MYACIVALQVCIEPAKKLNLALNSHYPRLLIVDPELSLLKVSQLERVHLHRPWSLQSSGRTSSSEFDSSRGLGVSASAAIPPRTNLALTLAICCLILSSTMFTTATAVR